MQDGPGPKSANVEERPLIEYPLDYTFKIMGLAGDDFAQYARRIVERVV